MYIDVCVIRLRYLYDLKLFFWSYDLQATIYKHSASATKLTSTKNAFSISLMNELLGTEIHSFDFINWHLIGI